MPRKARFSLSGFTSWFSKMFLQPLFLPREGQASNHERLGGWFIAQIDICANGRLTEKTASGAIVLPLASREGNSCLDTLNNSHSIHFPDRQWSDSTLNPLAVSPSTPAPDLAYITRGDTNRSPPTIALISRQAYVEHYGSNNDHAADRILHVRRD